MLRLLVLLVVFFVDQFIIAQNADESVLRIATINIRVPNKNDSLNQWNNRKEQMTDFIRDEKLDVICMQEVSVDQLKYLNSVLQEYDLIGDSPLVVKGEEYLPVFFKKECFICLDQGTFWLSETPDSAGSKGWDGKYARRATWVKLKCNNSSRYIFIVNTHLDHVGRIARQKGMDLIKERVKSLSEGLPVILCGDMNCTSTSPAYYIALNNEFLMYDAYHIAKARKGETYSYHGFGKQLPVEKRDMIDFVFVTSQLEVKEIDIPKEETLKGVYLTDHCPVIATICFVQ